MSRAGNNFFVESSTSHLFILQGFVLVFVTNSSCVYCFVSYRCPSLQVRSRLLWRSPHPEAGAGHPPLPKEGQPGPALHLSHEFHHDFDTLFDVYRLFLCSFLHFSRMGLTLVTPAATLYQAQLPAGAIATAINGTKWGRVEAPVEIKVNQNPMAWEEEATFRAPQPTVALTPAPMEPRITPTPTLIMAALHPCWLPAEAEREGNGQHLHGTAPPREVAGCWRGRLLQPSLLARRVKGVWTGRVEAHLLTSSSETAAPTVWVIPDRTRGLSVCIFGDICLRERGMTFKIQYSIFMLPNICGGTPHWAAR